MIGKNTIASDQPLTIGIRDSGVGGLTVARQIRQNLPRARVLYFADTAHVPYGDRSPVDVRHLALSITKFLIENGAQIVVFACNTTSAYALQIAKHRFDIPLFGTIEPGARQALQFNGSTPSRPIGVLATSATVQSRMYARWIDKLAQEQDIPQADSIEVACPKFVPLIEANLGESEQAHQACTEYLRPLQQAGVKTAILGCTHFPLLLPMLQTLAPEIHFTDPAQSLAQDVAQLVAREYSTYTGDPKNDTFYVSGPQDGVRQWIATLLGQENPQIKIGPKFTPPQIDG